MGAEILEFHAVFSRKMFGPDASSSLEMAEIKLLVAAVKNIQNAQKHPVDKNNTSHFSDLKNIFEKSLAVNKSLPAGHIFTFKDLEAKKPKGYGIAASEFQEVIGKKLNKDLNQWDFLKEGDLN
ncbi:N-acetylneuraminate synthase family protein [Antarcticibacterium sp. 1MA-6-2]|uniref:N-acetylneuraminate synthase family protein n=1 Tax=Antarcticibacterium sp. 1MA-6-2 TaxID=2908210 RepID=UPI002882EAFF|nr:N-acetylneuraminate synthase family protein [Antarcticibacterium sp. 1MA-6-2]